MVTSKQCRDKKGVSRLGRFFPRAGLLVAVVFVAASSAAQAQVPLSTYEDKNGNILVRKLTCEQLAGTFQEDADALALWYSGWYNGRLKRHVANIHLLREGLHEVIEYCKANPAKKVAEAIEVYLKK
jgi:hypothetical protein